MLASHQDGIHASGKQAVCGPEVLLISCRRHEMKPRVPSKHDVCPRKSDSKGYMTSTIDVELKETATSSKSDCQSQKPSSSSSG